MLIEIVKKNAIMQIYFALEAQRNEGKKPLEAIYQGCLIRFRPIMMTTMAALFGALPIAIGFGAGGEVCRPLEISVAEGLLFSQLVTLYLTPVVYTYMDSLKKEVYIIFKRGKEPFQISLTSLNQEIRPDLPVTKGDLLTNLALRCLTPKLSVISNVTQESLSKSWIRITGYFPASVYS